MSYHPHIVGVLIGVVVGLGMSLAAQELQTIGRTNPGHYIIYGTGTSTCAESVGFPEDRLSWTQGFVTGAMWLGTQGSDKGTHRIMTPEGLRAYLTEACRRAPGVKLVDVAGKVMLEIIRP